MFLSISMSNMIKVGLSVSSGGLTRWGWLVLTLSTSLSRWGVKCEVCVMVRSGLWIPWKTNQSALPSHRVLTWPQRHCQCEQPSLVLKIQLSITCYNLTVPYSWLSSMFCMYCESVLRIQ